MFFVKVCSGFLKKGVFQGGYVRGIAYCEKKYKEREEMGFDRDLAGNGGLLSEKMAQILKQLVKEPFTFFSGEKDGMMEMAGIFAEQLGIRPCETKNLGLLDSLFSVNENNEDDKAKIYKLILEQENDIILLARREFFDHLGFLPFFGEKIGFKKWDNVVIRSKKVSTPELFCPKDGGIVIFNFASKTFEYVFVAE
ncbi:MAG: hypothetical protein V1770_00115 [bacterium]